MSTIEMWWLSIGIFAVVTVVVAVLLGLVVAAARSIDRHAAAIWLVGKEIAGNTVTIWTLEETNERLKETSETARSLEEITASMDRKLQGLADARGGNS